MKVSDSLKRVAVTGGLSSGKTTVCKLFKELGAYVVSADTIVHKLLKPTTEIGQKVIELFGADIVVDGHIVRARIAEKAFQHPELLRSLENLLHPVVFEKIKKHYQCAEQSLFPLFVAEVPLLFESGHYEYYDATIAVIAEPKLCIERYKASGGTEEEYLRRMARQLSPQAKAEKASYVVVNNESIGETMASVANIYAEMLSTPPRGV